MTPKVAWYVHHHGRGHLSRAQAVLGFMRARPTVFTSHREAAEALPAIEVRALPMDVGGRSVGDPPHGLHYAPLECAGLRDRMVAMAEWVGVQRPALFVVDVSVEVTLLARLLGVPVAVWRQHGRRDDAAHSLAYGCAETLLAPFPRWLEDPDTPPEIAARTVYTGGFSRFDGLDRRVDGSVEGRVVVMHSHEVAASLAQAEPDREVVHLDGARVPFGLLCSAEVIVAGAGHNAVMEAAAARRPLLCLPEERPFGEQTRKAELLQRAGVAVVERTTPRGGEWGRLLSEAIALGGEGLGELVDGRGAARAAAHLDALAGGGPGQPVREPVSAMASPAGLQSMAPISASSRSQPSIGHSPHLS